MCVYVYVLVCPHQYEWVEGYERLEFSVGVQVGSTTGGVEVMDQSVEESSVPTPVDPSPVLVS